MFILVNGTDATSHTTISGVDPTEGIAIAAGALFCIVLLIGLIIVYIRKRREKYYLIHELKELKRAVIKLNESSELIYVS
jgi:hypothetical protein